MNPTNKIISAIEDMFHICFATNDNYVIKCTPEEVRKMLIELMRTDTRTTERRVPYHKPTEMSTGEMHFIEMIYSRYRLYCLMKKDTSIVKILTSFGRCYDKNRVAYAGLSDTEKWYAIFKDWEDMKKDSLWPTMWQFVNNEFTNPNIMKNLIMTDEEYAIWIRMTHSVESSVWNVIAYNADENIREIMATVDSEDDAEKLANTLDSLCRNKKLIRVCEDGTQKPYSIVFYEEKSL